MADYWLAPSLEQFRKELNALYPNRDKRSDGWIGDKYHAGGKSDHNPSQWPPSWRGVVRAFDADNDLGPGANGQTLWNVLSGMLGRHPALGSGAYLIYNSLIISTDRLSEGARRYTGKNPHTGHIHISVGTSPAAYNSTAPWNIAGGNAMTFTDTDASVNWSLKTTHPISKQPVRVVDLLAAEPAEHASTRAAISALATKVATTDAKVDQILAAVKSGGGAAPQIDYTLLAQALLKEMAK